MKITYSYAIAVIIILIGFVIILIAFGQPRELQVAIGLAGLAFIASGYIQIAQAHDNNKKDAQNEEKHRQIMEKLDKIEEKLEKIEPPQNTGVAIADVISSGLKYYAEHMTKPKEEDND